MRDRVMKTTRFHMHMHKLDQMNAKTFVNMFMDMGAANDPEVITLLHIVGICDERGRLGGEDNSVEHLHRIIEMFYAFMSVKFADVFPNGETNTNRIKDGMFRARVQAVRTA